MPKRLSMYYVAASKDDVESFCDMKFIHVLDESNTKGVHCGTPHSKASLMLGKASNKRLPDQWLMVPFVNATAATYSHGKAIGNYFFYVFVET